MNKKVILIIRDGWGVREEIKGNYIKQAQTPNIDFYEKNFPYTELLAHGKEVGIPEGKMGNSEIGHLHIGAGRIIPQSLLQINNAIEDDSFIENKTWIESLKNAQENQSTIHIIILMQEAGVHSYLPHLFAYLGFLKRNDFKDYNLHLISDGRDHNPKSSLIFIKKIKEELGHNNTPKIKTVCGRYFAMDRAGNTDRTEKFFNTVAFGQTANIFNKSESFIKRNYKDEIADEFLYPAKKKDYNGFGKNDSVVFLNFRTDRTIQFSQMLCYSKELQEKNIKYFTMTKYYKDICSKWAFDFPNIKNTLSEVLLRNFKRQLRLAESEKAAHVTFFFDGQKKTEDMLIKRAILNSPSVRTYEETPEMRALDLADIAVDKIIEGKTEFIFMNFANADMVGHTGNKKAILESIEAVDKAIGKIVPVAMKNNFVVMLAADHGNAEEKTSQFPTSHTLNPIPFSIISEDEKIEKLKLKDGLGLKNIAATVLEIMDIKKPEEMTRSIIDHNL